MDILDTDEAVALTRDRLAEEGGTMADLLGHFRHRISPILVGDPEWERVLECAGKHPITMGALPFGFELPLHERRPAADFGVSLTSGSRAGRVFPRTRRERQDGRGRESDRAAVRTDGLRQLASARDRRPQGDARI